MTKQLLALTLAAAVLVLAFPVAHAQAPAGPGAMGQGGTMDMMGMMQQMGDMMRQMSALMAGGQMGPDRMKPIGEMMGQMAEMMKQMTGMTERMAEMQKRMAEMMGAK